LTAFEPIKFRSGAWSKNRIALAPMTNCQSHDDGSLGDDEFRWLARRARGGFGITSTCAAHVSRDGRGFPGELGVFDDALLPGLEKLATMMRESESLGLVQIFHGGERSLDKRDWVHTASETDLARLIDDFATAAVRCEKAGFSGVELHGAHGYVLGQFLSASNDRDDAWGGAFENRTRLIVEATRAVRARVRPSFVVGVRISPEDFGQAKGLDLDESVAVAKMLADETVDFVHLSLWDYKRNTKKRPDANAITLFREALPPEVLLVACGSMWTIEDVNAAIAKGADLVALGRSAILNPEWPANARVSSWTPARPPMSPADFRARDVSDTFIGYLRGWKNFVEG
jgi:2,4-dienoyl-CoA reductase-like NADH-dependent reductase (Old Yellow Enzyme family)